MYKQKTGSLIREGILSGVPIFLGYFSAAVAFGILARDAGLSLLQGVGFSVFCFTGAAQFLAINLIAAGVTPFEVIFTFSLVNFRYFLMSSSLQPRFAAKSNLVKMLLVYGVTDENYSVASLREGPVESPYYAALSLTSWSGWVGGTLTGFLIGSVLPMSLQGAIGGSLYALFLALLLPEGKKNSSALWIALASGLVNSLLVVVFHLSMGWGVVISMIFVSALFTLLKIRRKG